MCSFAPLEHCKPTLTLHHERMRQVSELYGSKLDKPTKEAQQRSNAAGMGFGFSQLCMFGGWIAAVPALPSHGWSAVMSIACAREPHKGIGAALCEMLFLLDGPAMPDILYQACRPGHHTSIRCPH